MPRSVVDPPATWVLDVGVPVVCLVVLAVLVRGAVRRRVVTWSLLLATCSALVWWLETFGDWGQHLSYSPNFAHYVLTWRWTAPHNPDWMPLMYAVYWVAHAWAILRIAQWLQRRRPGLTLGRAILYLSVPVTFVWNLVVEGFATYVGWWTYDPPIGPYLHLGRGNWPLLWPMLALFGWINLIAWMVGPPEEQAHLNRIERLFGLGRLLARPEWRSRTATDPDQGGPAAAIALPSTDLGSARFQLVRFGAWLAFFTVSFAVCLDVPLVGLRLLSGWNSRFLP